MITKFIIFLTALILTSVKTFAGWYNSYNYVGSIDKYQVTLSFQIKEEYFGEPTKKSYNVIGVYKYNKFNNPIRLEGIFDQKTQVLKIYEIGLNSQVSATFNLNFSSQKLTGSWNNGKGSLKVNLQLVNKLSDLSDEAFDDVNILQFPSLKNYYFIVVYAKKSKSTRAYMSALKIIKKESNETFQTLNFENIETPTGNVMTIIYDNITIGKGNNFLVSNEIGRVGGYLNVRFNVKDRRFVLNPEPVAEGGNGD